MSDFEQEIRRLDEVPTCHIRFQGGQLMQLWEWTEARWNSQFGVTQYFAMKGWRKVLEVGDEATGL